MNWRQYRWSTLSCKRKKEKMGLTKKRRDQLRGDFFFFNRKVIMYSEGKGFRFMKIKEKRYNWAKPLRS